MSNNLVADCHHEQEKVENHPTRGKYIPTKALQRLMLQFLYIDLPDWLISIYKIRLRSPPPSTLLDPGSKSGGKTNTILIFFPQHPDNFAKREDALIEIPLPNWRLHVVGDLLFAVLGGLACPTMPYYALTNQPNLTYALQLDRRDNLLGWSRPPHKSSNLI